MSMFVESNFNITQISLNPDHIAVPHSKNNHLNLVCAHHCF
jgi:hypothetical protein